MNYFAKQFARKYFVLTLIVGIAAASACSSVTTEKSANDKTSAAAQNSSINDKNNSLNRTAENKQTENNTVETQQVKMIEIYDGRKEPNYKDAAAADTSLAEKEFKAKESVIKQKFGDAYCVEDEINGITVTGAASGSFTKPNSKQKALLYEVCSSGSSHFGVGGLMIFEDDKIVSHYVYGENGLFNGEMFALPDINKNGLSELVLTEGQTHQGYGSGSLEIVEFKDGNLTSLGGATTQKDNGGAEVDESKQVDEAYKISVAPSANPTFYRETYQMKGNAKNWALERKSEKFSLDKGDFGKNYKIN